MDFTALKQELSDRGFSYLSTTRLGQYINWARAELDETELWSYRMTTVAGAAPLTISDLGTIETVADTADGSLQLAPVDRRDLSAWYSDLTTTGTPIYFFVDNGIVRTYPVGGTLSVRYYKVPADLSAGTDTPLVPTRFQRLIVDLAVERAYRDSDNHREAEQLRVSIERDLNTMRQALLLDQVAGPQSGVQILGWRY